MRSGGVSMGTAAVSTINMPMYGAAGRGAATASGGALNGSFDLRPPAGRRGRDVDALREAGRRRRTQRRRRQGIKISPNI
ncbi:Hypothetical protein NTJ_12465 [Nesidiocoris tenuis]|uniref:Uncharacterized protein n=1 Tax=Nesidiocoris tenuis TaxID=355587 RepID=A0ABN7B5W0_9HEMI|nr:Hypothetical protein NTJ_12465 [Nesidiocoris tenuis]